MRNDDDAVLSASLLLRYGREVQVHGCGAMTMRYHLPAHCRDMVVRCKIRSCDISVFWIELPSVQGCGAMTTRYHPPAYCRDMVVRSKIRSCDVSVFWFEFPLVQGCGAMTTRYYLPAHCQGMVIRCKFVLDRAAFVTRVRDNDDVVPSASLLQR
ncbi:uncharacterized protein HD556DRAFT_1311251 [Suillus plorans]|uniref:Uncharacterized protein n=1 Tax=Suillus plorans TaxID=116603 RepID=A0A9P7DEF7_9AGAM|nr:uncharacterized protein HD556DRAFT_1311251 [Suillus plorans]KAG1789485.1 hypothetical protein HD556DRAFT_1311251 [Suillus plorans]